MRNYMKLRFMVQSNLYFSKLSDISTFLSELEKKFQILFYSLDHHYHYHHQFFNLFFRSSRNVYLFVFEFKTDHLVLSTRLNTRFIVRAALKK